MKKIDQIKLDALSYCNKNKRPIKSIDDFIAGYNLAITDLHKLNSNQFKELSKIIIENIIKRKRNEFYDPNMGAGRRNELNGEISIYKETLEIILSSKLI